MGIMWSDLETDCESCRCILDSLKSIQKVLWYIREQPLQQSSLECMKTEMIVFVLLTVQILRY